MDVILLDRDQESADKGKAGIQKSLDEQVMKGGSEMDDRNALLARISTTTSDYAALANVDLIVEAVFESREVKKDVTEKTQKPSSAATSCSARTPRRCRSPRSRRNFSRQKDFIGIHFFSPVDKMMLVEIIMGKKTGPKALAVALDYV